MKDKVYRLAGLKHQLREKRKNDIKKVIWKLNDEQRTYVESLGYEVTPFIYEITTRKIPVIGKGTSAIVKDVHWSFINGKRKIYRKLKVKDIQKLREYGIYYRVSKYEILLR